MKTIEKSSLSAELRRFANDKGLTLEELEKVTNKWTAPKSPEDVERSRKRNMELMGGGKRIVKSDIKDLYSLCKKIVKSQAITVEVTYLDYTASIRIARWKLPRIRLIKNSTGRVS